MRPRAARHGGAGVLADYDVWINDVTYRNER